MRRYCYCLNFDFGILDVSFGRSPAAPLTMWKMMDGVENCRRRSTMAEWWWWSLRMWCGSVYSDVLPDAVYDDSADDVGMFVGYFDDENYWRCCRRSYMLNSCSDAVTLSIDCHHIGSPMNSLRMQMQQPLPPHDTASNYGHG